MPVRIGRDQLIFRALAVLDETANACTQGVIQPSIGLRFALMFLYAVGRGGREAHDGFWRVIQDEQESAPSESTGNYIRQTSARTMMTGIARNVGVDLSAGYTTEFRVALMSSEERRAHRAEKARLAEHRRRLLEDGWQYAQNDLEEAER